jgi:hypothetical protein
MYHRTGSKYFDAPDCPDVPQRPRAYKVREWARCMYVYAMSVASKPWTDGPVLPHCGPK